MSNMILRGQKILFHIDTGATCNILWKAELPPRTKILPSNTMLSFYNGVKELSEGDCELELTNPKTG